MYTCELLLKLVTFVHPKFEFAWVLPDMRSTLVQELDFEAEACVGTEVFLDSYFATGTCEACLCWISWIFRGQISPGFSFIGRPKTLKGAGHISWGRKGSRCLAFATTSLPSAS